jgi:hypothetical protein
MTTPYRLRAPRPASGDEAADALGPLLRSYRIEGTGHLIWAAAPFVLLLGYGVWLAQQGLLAQWFNSTFSVLAVAALFVMSVVLIAHTAAAGGVEVVRVHANGLLDLRDGQTIRWDEVKALTAVWSPQARRIEQHVLATRVGTRVTLGRAIGGIERLVDEIRARMVETQLASLQTHLAEGGSLRFGALRASADGLAIGDRSLPWSEVGQIEMEGADVVVRGPSGAAWSSSPTQDVPNAFLLAELAERRR